MEASQTGTVLQDQDSYLAAYAAWRYATESFEERMRRVVRGEPADAMRLAIDATALMRLHTEWLEKSLALATDMGGLIRLAGGDDRAAPNR